MGKNTLNTFGDKNEFINQYEGNYSDAERRIVQQNSKTNLTKGMHSKNDKMRSESHIGPT